MIYINWIDVKVFAKSSLIADIANVEVLVREY